jgi:hypothetical protein
MTAYQIRNHLRLTLVTGILAAGLAACTEQNWYQGVQSSHQAHCMKQPVSEYEECMQQSNESYLDYEKNREELSKDPEKY